MKKFVAIVLMLVMLVSLTACGGTDSEEISETTEPAQAETAEGSETTDDNAGDEPQIDYPKSKELTIVFGKKTGSMGDLIIRSVARYLQDEIGKPVVVVNQKGAGGIVAATDFLQSQEANSDTIILFGNALFTIMPLVGQVDFTLDDYQPLIGLDGQQRIMFVNPDKEGIQSVEDLVNYGKENRILYTSSGVGTSKDLAFQTFFTEAGVTYDMVTDDGSPLASVLGKHVDVCLAAPADGEDYYREGLIPIAVLSEEPYTGYEGIEVPTLISAGYDITDEGYRFIAMAKDTDPEIVDYMYEKINNVFNNPEFIAEMETMEVEMKAHRPEEIVTHIGNMQDRLKTYIEVTGLE